MGSDHKAAYRGSISQSTSCEDLEDEQPLNSAVAAVVKNLKKDEKLILVLDESDKPARVLAKTKDGKTAGAITSTLIGKLISCMREGHTYQGVVMSVTGASAVVRFFHLRGPGA